MSLDSFQAFRDKVAGNPELQLAARPYLTPTFDFDQVARVGRENGFDFSADEAKQAIGEVMANPNRELADFELELVAGGGTTLDYK